MQDIYFKVVEFLTGREVQKAEWWTTDAAITVKKYYLQTFCILILTLLSLV